MSDSAVSGNLTGENADLVRKFTRASTPITVTAKKIIQYPKNCARIHTIITQSNVETKTGGHAPFSFWYEINICPSGGPAIDQTVLKRFSINQVR